MDPTEEQVIEETANKYQRFSVLENFTAVSVAFSSTFTTALSIFTSIMLYTYHTSNTPSIDIPILFLIISTFGFLYATMVYSLNSGHLIRNDLSKFMGGKLLGGILSEYLGVYFLLLAIPLIINLISSSDYFLKIATTIIDLGGLIVYHASGFSIMQRSYKNLHYIWLLCIIIFESELIIFQNISTPTLSISYPIPLQLNNFQIIATGLILFIFSLASFALLKDFKKK